MENENIMEQPTNSNSQSANGTYLEVGENDELQGSILGKFKTVKELETAYQNLQAEFTKKSQKLSDALKGDNLTPNAKVLKTEDNVNLINTSKQPLHEVKPQFEGENWQENVTEFLKKNPVAKEYATQITSLLVKDKQLSQLPNSLEVAYWKVLANNFKSERELLSDEKFVAEKILTNEKIIQKVLKNYVDGIQKQKTPVVIGAQGGSSVGLTPQERPKSLKEAAEVFTRMLKTK